MNEKKAIIKKWYDELGFPKEYDAEFARALDEFDDSKTVSIAEIDTKREPSLENLLIHLYCCEELEEKYNKQGLPRRVLLDTLYDIVVWTKEWTAIRGKMALGTLDWLSHHFNMRLFRLGRLQYYPSKARGDIDALGVKAGDDILDVHIPADGKLTPEACEASFRAAIEFFRTYFGTFDFKCFTCHSWLLDDTLKKFFPPESNTTRFGDMFIKLKEDNDNALVRYMFPWDTTMDNLAEREPKTRTAAIIKDALLAGEQFHVTLGARALS